MPETGEMRLKCTVANVAAVDYVSECTQLLEAIAKWEV